MDHRGSNYVLHNSPMQYQQEDPDMMQASYQQEDPEPMYDQREVMQRGYRSAPNEYQPPADDEDDTPVARYDPIHHNHRPIENGHLIVSVISLIMLLLIIAAMILLMIYLYKLYDSSMSAIDSVNACITNMNVTANSVQSSAIATQNQMTKLVTLVTAITTPPEYPV